ncbi:hypothetical protein FRC01_002554 [Tulasnella sp. 417]|nr:hypothetical protein FRC01_002554 [Tulasnella sp. 417]
MRSSKGMQVLLDAELDPYSQSGGGGSGFKTGHQIGLTPNLLTIATSRTRQGSATHSGASLARSGTPFSNDASASRKSAELKTLLGGSSHKLLSKATVRAPCSEQPAADHPLRTSTAQTLFMGGSGKLQIAATLHRRIWVAGQRCYVTLNNETTKKVKTSTFTLVRTTTMFQPKAELDARSPLAGEDAHIDACETSTSKKEVAQCMLEMGQKGERCCVTAKGFWTGVEPGGLAELLRFIQAPVTGQASPARSISSTQDRGRARAQEMFGGQPPTVLRSKTIPFVDELHSQAGHIQSHTRATARSHFFASGSPSRPEPTVTRSGSVALQPPKIRCMTGPSPTFPPIGMKLTASAAADDEMESESESSGYTDDDGAIFRTVGSVLLPQTAERTQPRGGDQSFEVDAGQLGSASPIIETALAGDMNRDVGG